MENKKDIYILGIESSCDETSCSIVKNGEEEINPHAVNPIYLKKTEAEETKGINAE